MKGETKSDSLIASMDEAAKELLKSLSQTTIPAVGDSAGSQPVDAKSKVAIFAAVTNYLQVKHKIKPDGDEKGAIDGYRSAINGGTPRRTAGRGKAREADLGSGAAAPDG